MCLGQRRLAAPSILASQALPFCNILLLHNRSKCTIAVKQRGSDWRVRLYTQYRIMTSYMLAMYIYDNSNATAKVKTRLTRQVFYLSYPMYV